MARTKAFDPDDALERAMETFWAHGFEATSTHDLERALGINRSSMYATFGSKGDLYARALERYTSGMHGPGPVRPGALDGVGPLRERIEALLWRVVAMDLDGNRSRGCFACNAAVELGPDDARVRRLVSQSFRAARSVFRDALAEARDAGELPADADVDALAALFVGVVEGLHVLAKGTGDRRQIKQTIAGALAVLPI